jgi:hypothetical protein
MLMEWNDVVPLLPVRDNTRGVSGIGTGSHDHGGDDGDSGGDIPDQVEGSQVMRGNALITKDEFTKARGQGTTVPEGDAIDAYFRILKLSHKEQCKPF